jgi:hypothetical protein
MKQQDRRPVRGPGGVQSDRSSKSLEIKVPAKARKSYDKRLPRTGASGVDRSEWVPRVPGLSASRYGTLDFPPAEVLAARGFR